MIGEMEGGLRMTTEQRLARLEETTNILGELMATVVGMVQRQEDLIGQQQEILARQQEQLGDIVSILQHQREELAEVREDTNMTRRMWVRLAMKHGWLDDEDVEGT